MTDTRTYLLQALELVADGGDVTRQELDAAISNPRTLSRAEKDAWEELSHWADDGDIRGRDERYATFKREWMRDRREALFNSDG